MAQNLGSMTDNLTSNESMKKARHKYAGDVDANGLRTNRGCEVWQGEDGDFQKYTGQFLHNNIHCSGFYSMEKGDDRVFYDGFFYANNLEGYCHIFYGNDASHFQGLFRNGRRFGPGMFTYANGNQDIGLWDGFDLRRLSVCVAPDLVPRLAQTSTAKIKLLKYRQLIPVSSGTVDVATEIFNHLQANSTRHLKDNVQKLYNLDVRHPNSIFFNKQDYDAKFFGNDDCTIDIVMSPLESQALNKENRKSSNVQAKTDRSRQIQQQLDKITKKLCHIQCLQKYIRTQIRRCKKCCYSNDEATGDLAVEEMEELDGEDAPPDLCGFINPDLHGIEALTAKLGSLEKEEAFYKAICTNLEVKLNKELTNTKEDQSETRPVNVTDLLSWNNEPIFVAMLKHTFTNRKSERMVTFNLSTLMNDRQIFGRPGKYEQNCQSFLSKCSTDTSETLTDLQLKFKINPDLCDANGNTGLIFAAAKDNIEAISVLVESGAKLDIVNDEGLTPLNLCLLRYLSYKNNCASWEQAFLSEIDLKPEDKQEICHKWYPHMSLLSVSHASFKESPIEDNKRIVVENDLAFDQDRLLEVYRKLLTMYSPAAEAATLVKKNVEYIFTTEPIPPGDASTKKNEVLQTNDKKLIEIHGTIMTLLSYGANPNIGYVPLPPVIMSVFSGNPEMVRQLLEAHAQVTVCMEDKNLNCLHIVASLNPSMENLRIAEILLQFGCNPNEKTSTAHWPRQKIEMMGNGVEPDNYVDDGKNVLHLLALRADHQSDSCGYFERMARILIENHVDVNDFYLGHSPLSLAVLRGNIQLIQAILKTQSVNPHEILGYDMGNALTVGLLKRFAGMLSLEETKKILDLLVVDLGMNPLNEIDRCENAVDFIEQDYKTKSKKKLPGDGSNRKKQSKSSKSSKTAGQSSPNKLKEHLKDLARRTILEQIQMRCVQALYCFVEDKMMDEPLVTIPTTFLATPEVALAMLTRLFQCDQIDADRFNYDNCLELLQFVDQQKVIPTLPKYQKRKKSDNNTKKTSKADAEKTLESLSSPPQDFSGILNSTDFSPAKDDLLKPGLDVATAKYTVCFHCLKSRGKTLFACPICQMIYFCSEQCNMANIKLPFSGHPCGVVFYRELEEHHQNLEDVQTAPPTNKLTELIDLAMKHCALRLQVHKQFLLKMKWERYEAEKRADVYGTRFFKKSKYVCQQPPQNVATISAKTMTNLASKASSTKNVLHVATQDADSIFRVAIEMASTKLHVHYRRRRQTDAKNDVYDEKKDELRRTTVTHGSLAVDKLKKIPKKCQYFMQLLHRFFPDIDFSSLLLPYACFAGGQLYYKFSEFDLFAQTYSMT